ncbi:sigma-70 family RNA polymerase sigma factor [Vibrio sp. Of7-15]|uniref:sigma-70 family RNA polymerase sigma factor n=1 Tax=Vibrio sp. Of7-15 TaxID=2724879 RepID=UPI001EF23552|nr:sigma-70 family RNA polymerase sigma factor [Vibrio sp. Of7-15]MCG7497873.1 sigma-70 family RNA polymerase sigma factor [Vibrio sp. Of7-15]
MQQKEGKAALVRGEHLITQLTNQPVSQKLSQWLSLVALSQDKDAFTKLFGFFAPKIKNFGIKQYNDESQANELVQDTMANVWKKAHLYDVSKGAATTWVYTVMRNTSFDQLRKLKSTAAQNIGDDIWPLEQVQSESEATSPIEHDHLLTKQLSILVNNLPATQRVVVKGMYYQELSQEQLSQQLGVPIGTIKSRLRLALKKIAQQMGEKDHD